MQDKKKIIISATLNSAYSKTYGNESNEENKKKNVLNLKDITDDVKKALTEVFENKPPKWQPMWFKEGMESVQLKSTYDIPVMLVDEGEKMSFQDFVERGLIRGAKVRVSVNLKDGAIYPVAMMVDVDGEEYDAFADF